jgi:hypothetical protein
MRMKVAVVLANAAGPTAVSALADGTEQAKLAALARLLCVDSWTERTTAALRLDIGDPRRLLSVGLISPEYCVT